MIRADRNETDPVLEQMFERMGINLTYDELKQDIGPKAYKKIGDAGFQLIPIKWVKQAAAALVSIREAIDQESIRDAY